MKELFLLYMATALSCFCLAQDRKQPNRTDTLRIDQISIQHQITFVTDSITIITSYEDFLVFLKTLKNKVFNTSYLKARHNDIKYALKLVKMKKKTVDTVDITDTIINRVGCQFIAAHFAKMIEAGKAVLLDKNKILQTKIIRNRTSYQRDMLNGWGGREYYIPGSKKYFLVVTDWVS
jgi:hypothetical protein